MIAAALISIYHADNRNDVAATLLDGSNSLQNRTAFRHNVVHDGDRATRFE